MTRKPVGWRNEPTRHSMARRGIGTTGDCDYRGMGVRQLPTTERLGKDYYVDERLNQLRNVNDPHDIIPLKWYDNRMIRETVNNALIHGMGMEFTVMKNGETGTVILEQHPNYRTALYPDMYGRETPDWIFKDLEDIMGSGNVYTNADGVMEHIIASIRQKGYTIYSEEV